MGTNVPAFEPAVAQSNAAAGMGLMKAIRHHRLAEVLGGGLKDCQIVQVAATCRTSHALDSKGGIHAWGNAQSGALGLPLLGPEETRITVPEQVYLRGIKARHIEAGPNNFWAWMTPKEEANAKGIGHLYVCGPNHDKQSGVNQPNEEFQMLTRVVPGKHTPVLFSVSDRHGLILVETEDSTLYSCEACSTHFTGRVCVSCSTVRTSTTRPAMNSFDCWKPKPCAKKEATKPSVGRTPKKKATTTVVPPRTSERIAARAGRN